MNPLLKEYDAFQRATNSLQEAADAIKIVADCRPDQRNQWLTLAQTLEISRQALYRLAGTGVIKS